MKSIFGLLVVALIFANVGASQDAAHGKRLYEKYGCYTCHGHLGQGGIAGSRIAPRPIAISAFLKYVRRPVGSMPPYTEKVMKDSELTEIHAYLASIPNPRPAKEIPLLNR